MQATTPIKSISLIDRQRKDIKPKHIGELKSSILSKGLLHPVVLSRRDVDGVETLVLLAGECRLRSMTELHEEGLSFNCNGSPVPRFEIPYTLVSDLSADDIMEAELEENLFRLPLTWQEEAEAKAKIHYARQAKNPAQTKTQTALEIATKTGAAPSTEVKELNNAIKLFENRDNPRLKKARSANEGMKILLQEQETKALAQLAIVAAKEVKDLSVRQGDAFELMKTVPDGTVSTIFFDPPYGINAHQQGKDAKHFYEDDPDYAVKFCNMMFAEGFRVTKPRAIMFMFCDIEHFVLLRSSAQRMGWSTWRTPIIWYKGDTGSAPWGRAGFIRTYEVMLFAVKGQKELIQPGGSDVINFSRVRRNERVHAAEKPVDLLRKLLSISTLPGETVLDPCCGSGNIVTAARYVQANIIAFEKDPTYFAEAIQKVTSDLAPLPPEEEPQPEMSLEEI